MSKKARVVVSLAWYTFIFAWGLGIGTSLLPLWAKIILSVVLGAATGLFAGVMANRPEKMP